MMVRKSPRLLEMCMSEDAELARLQDRPAFAVAVQAVGGPRVIDVTDSGESAEDGVPERPRVRDFVALVGRVPRKGLFCSVSCVLFSCDV